LQIDIKILHVTSSVEKNYQYSHFFKGNPDSESARRVSNLKLSTKLNSVSSSLKKVIILSPKEKVFIKRNHQLLNTQLNNDAGKPCQRKNTHWISLLRSIFLNCVLPALLKQEQVKIAI
jgi:hypothetical protein